MFSCKQCGCTLAPMPRIIKFRGFPLEAKQHRNDADPLFASSAEVKNEWSYTFSLPVCPHGMHSDNLTFLSLHIWEM